MKTLLRLFPALLLAIPVYASAGTVLPLVNVNGDDAWQIHHDLTGISQEVAHNIVRYRQENGAFTSKYQLLRVPGFGRDNLNLDWNNISIHKVSGTADRVS